MAPEQEKRSSIAIMVEVERKPPRSTSSTSKGWGPGSPGHPSPGRGSVPRWLQPPDAEVPAA